MVGLRDSAFRITHLFGDGTRVKLNQLFLNDPKFIFIKLLNTFKQILNIWVQSFHLIQCELLQAIHPFLAYFFADNPLSHFCYDGA